MAGNMAWKVGKGAVEKFSGKNSRQDPTPKSVDHAYYRGAKVERGKKNGQSVLFLNDKNIAKHRKDSVYYEYKGIPKKDAKILSHVVFWARFLDNGISAPGIPFKLGVSSIVGIIPEVGDFVGSGLSLVLVWRPARQVSKGNDPDAKQLKKVLNRNFCKGFVIGLVPLAGDFFDSWIKFNVRSADALEAMLLKRVGEDVTVGGDAEKLANMNGYHHAGTNGHHPAATNRYNDSEPPTQPARRFLGDNDLRQDRRPAATDRKAMVQTQPEKDGGTFFQRRRRPQGSQDLRTTVEGVAAGRPTRPEHSNHGRGGHF